MKEPNGFKTPFWWQQFRWQFDSVNYMQILRERFGAIFTIRALHSECPVVFVSDPEAIKELLTKHTEHYRSAGELSSFLSPIMGERSVFVLNGEEHRRHRRLLMPPFHGERLQAYGQLICDITQQVMADLLMDKQFLVRTAMQDITMKILMKAVFGWHDKERGEQFKQLRRKLQTDFRVPFIMLGFFMPSLQLDLGKWSPWVFFLENKRQQDELLYAEIRERYEQPNPEANDVLNLLMSARDEAGQPLSDLELRDEMMTLLLAGEVTTSGALSWLLYLVHKHPQVREKLLEELDSLGESPGLTSILQLPYLNAVCNETLRLYSPEPLTKGKMVRSPFELMGYQLNPGTAVYICLHLLHRCEDIYPEPLKFRPERFLEREFSNYEFMPFGRGPRRCIGAALAQMSMKLVLATILSNYQLKLADNRLPRTFPPGTTVAPIAKIVMQGKRRRQEQPLVAATT